MRVEALYKRLRFFHFVWLILPLLVLGAGAFIWTKITPSYQGKRLDYWLSNLDSSKKDDRREAKEAIKKIGAKAVPFLGGELHRRDSKLNQWLANEFGTPFEFTPSEDYKKRALLALDILGPEGRKALPDLKKMLRRGELPSSVVNTIVHVDPEPMDFLIEMMSHTNSKVRSAVSWKLGQLQPHDEKSIKMLISALADPELDVRSGSANSLGKIGLFPELVVPALAASLDATKRMVEMNKVRYSPRRYGAKAKLAVPKLLILIEKREGGLKGDVISVLRAIDLDAANREGFGTPDLVRMLNSSDELSKFAALVAIWQSRDNPPEFISPLMDVLSDSNDDIRRLAIIILGDYEESAKEALTALARALEDPSVNVRYMATSAIRKIDSTWLTTNSRIK